MNDNLILANKKCNRFKSGIQSVKIPNIMIPNLEFLKEHTKPTLSKTIYKNF